MARANPVVQPMAAEIIDIEETEGARAAYAALQKRLETLRRDGDLVPSDLAKMEHRLAVECYAMSQGR